MSSIKQKIDEPHLFPLSAQSRLLNDEPLNPLPAASASGVSCPTPKREAGIEQADILEPTHAYSFVLRGRLDIAAGLENAAARCRYCRYRDPSDHVCSWPRALSGRRRLSVNRHRVRRIAGSATVDPRSGLLVVLKCTCPSQLQPRPLSNKLRTLPEQTSQNGSDALLVRQSPALCPS
jgi:hypothetical protein